MSLFTELKRRNVIRVAIAYIAGAWLLTEVSGTLFPVFGIPDWGVLFVVIVLALGFLPALIISWAYELTPEGLKREKDVVRDTSITHLTAKRLDGITIGLIVVALAFIMADRMWLSPRLAVHPPPKTEVVTDNAQASEPEPQYPPNSIAVLPFVNMSSDPEQEYFSDGISEELLNLLANIPELRVISRSSAFSFKGKELDMRTIATQLNVAYILEGSVRKDDNQVRITAQLIEARSDTHLWSETYDRELENIFVVQDEISAAITKALTQRLGLKVENAPRTTAIANTEAHEAYLRGRYLIVQRTPATVEGAAREFEKAISLDPDYALAHAELAITILLLRRTQYGGLTHREGIDRATPHVERAMVLDPALAKVHAAAGLLLVSQENWPEALTHYRKAIEINPNSSIVYVWMALLLGNHLGLYSQEFDAIEKAQSLDPLSVLATLKFAVALITRNQLAEAERESEKLATMAPGWYASVRGMLTSRGGKWADAVLGNLDGVRINPGYISSWNNLALKFTLIGLEKEALAVSKVPLLNVLRMLGKTEGAVTTAEAYLSENPTSFIGRRDLGLALASAGDYVRAQPLLEGAWQHSGGRIARSEFQTVDAAALIAIRRSINGEAEVGELLAAIRDNVRRYREAGITSTTVVGANLFFELSPDFEEGLATYLAGDSEDGLALIAKVAEDGFFIPPNDAYLRTLYDDPGFAPIIASQEARQARERNRFLSTVCTNNPYEAVWQPAEGTCEQFVAEGAN